jgi:phosphatidylinositol glycan class N
MNIISFFYSLLVISLFIGFSFLLGYSLFDVNYKFSISYGMTPHSPELSEDEIPSKRVVLFLLDGSTSDTFYKASNMGQTPYLREILEKRGIFGYARTMAPTESIPCLTAISTGHYQDGSLALKHLSDQKVTFDTIYNESDHAWGLGEYGCLFQNYSRNMD